MLPITHFAICRCGTCKKDDKKHCVFLDGGVNEVIDKLESTDGLIVGSPVYYASPNGTVLSFLDRMFCAGSSYLASKPAAAVVSARRAGTTASLDAINKYFTINRMPVVSSNYWNMAHSKIIEQSANRQSLFPQTYQMKNHIAVNLPDKIAAHASFLHKFSKSKISVAAFIKNVLVVSF